MFSCAWEGGTSSIFGGHKPQNTLQWHWACYFILERNPRLGAQFSLGGEMVTSSNLGFFEVLWTTLRVLVGIEDNFGCSVLCLQLFVLCVLPYFKQATALQRFQEAQFRKPLRNKPKPETKFWPLLCISCSCPVIKAHRLRQTHIFLSQV